jgi:hypothetical protein
MLSRPDLGFGGLEKGRKGYELVTSDFLSFMFSQYFDPLSTTV